MAAEKKKAKEDVQFPLNTALLEESAKIKEARETIKERLSKIEGSKSEVSEMVYQKVKADYTEKLDENTNQLLEKKQDIDRELSTLYEAKKKVEENVSTHRERLEELNFRKELGEFEDEEFHKIADGENEKLGKFEKILAAIVSNIKQYESLFEGEKELAGEEKEVPEAEVPPPPSAEPEEKGPQAEESTPMVEEKYQVGEGSGYFGVETEDIPLDIEGKPEATSKEVKAPEEGDTAKAEISLAKLTITEGDGKGESYTLEDEEITIGRASSNFIVLKEAKVSRQHASIKRQGNGYLLEDLHSSNGVFVNDEKVKEHVLNNGDIIRIGDFILKFSTS